MNDRLRTDLLALHLPEDAMQDIDKRSMIWEMFMSSTLEASVFSERIIQKILLPSTIQGKISL